MKKIKDNNKAFMVFNDDCKYLEELNDNEVGIIFRGLVKLSTECAEIDNKLTEEEIIDLQDEIIADIKNNMENPMTRLVFDILSKSSARCIRGNMKTGLNNKINGHVATIKRYANKLGERATIEAWEKDNKPNQDILKEFAERIVYGEEVATVTNELIELIRANKPNEPRVYSNASAYKPINTAKTEPLKKEITEPGKIDGAVKSRLISHLGGLENVEKVLEEIYNDKTINLDNVADPFEFVMDYYRKEK